MKYEVNENGFYGEFGGAFIPELLHHNCEELSNALDIIIDKFAPGILDKSDFILINSSISGCLSDIVSICAARLASAPIICAFIEYNSIKLTAPVLDDAALFTFAPLGLRLDMSVPHPPLFEYITAFVFTESNIDEILSSGDGVT